MLSWSQDVEILSQVGDDTGWRGSEIYLQDDDDDDDEGDWENEKQEKEKMT